ncbi:CHAT domain-containing protein [Nocardia sp. NPDC052566]|uniref:CHAT domain-containing protein n=1 Tax=Nocardia sp. NPDC052566 TaxID=3364330 RepID=UPI0037CB3E6E
MGTDHPRTPAADNGRRARLHTALERRLDRIDRDPNAVLDPGAAQEAAELATLLTDGAKDDDVASRVLLGRFWWSRALLGPSEQAADARERAVETLIPVFTTSGTSLDGVPAELVRTLADTSVELARSLYERARAADDPDLVTAAAQLWHRIVDATPDDHPDLTGRLSALGLALVRRFERVGVQADIDEAVEVSRRAVAATAADQPATAEVLTTLGIALRVRFGRTGTPADIDEAVDMARQAVTATPTGHPDLVAALANLGLALRRRLERTEALGDIDEAVDMARQAVTATPTDHPGRAGVLTTLSLALRVRFGRTGVLADVDEAIDVARQAVTATPADHPDRISQLSSLGLTLQRRFERTGTLSDINEAVDMARQAVTTAPDDHPSLAGWRTNLCGTLLRRFERTGALADIDEAASVARQAVTDTPADDPHLAGWLNNLGLILRVRFERTAVLADINEAVDVARQAVTALPADHPHHTGQLSNLGLTLRVRFERTGVLADLDEAVDVARQAVTTLPADHPLLASQLSVASLALWRRFERTGALADIDEAVDVARQAATTTPDDHPALPIFLTNLGLALQTRFERTGAPADIDEAVDVARQAATTTPDDHPDLAGSRSDLSVALRRRFERTGAARDLDEAVDVARQATTAAPDDHPDRAGLLTNLGLALQTRFERTGATADRDAAVEAHRTAAGSAVASPSQRIRAARHAADLLAASSPADAAGLLAGAVRLLPEVVPRRLHRSDQQYAIGRYARLAADAAALTLADPDTLPDERAESAIRLLELGRAVIMNQALNLRGETRQLADTHPDLAMEFMHLRDLFDRNPIPDPTASTTPRTDRRQVAHELEQVLARIRAHPGFESFALPPDSDELLAQAGEGPIVVFNISHYRSDALLVTSATVTCLPLPGLAPSAVADRASAFLQALDDVQHATSRPEVKSGQRHLSDTLEWLWDNATGPVLDALGYHGPPIAGEPLPRLWWIPSGPLTQLPLHAAGYHTHPTDHAAPTRAVVDRVVSSYIPTITALRHARRRTHGTTALEDVAALVVTMPTTPAGASRLSHVAREAATVAARIPTTIVLTEPDADTALEDEGLLPTKANVLTWLPSCAIAHFACHGVNDPADPARGQLLLHDHTSNPLTVADLDAIRLDHAQLAYLSACETTAATTTPELLDESIHLASAFQLAGYPHVIGTLWPVNDRVAAAIADTFYRALPGNPYPETSHAAHALHHAIAATRHRYPSTPSLWAAHLHIGA